MLTKCTRKSLSLLITESDTNSDLLNVKNVLHNRKL